MDVALTMSIVSGIRQWNFLYTIEWMYCRNYKGKGKGKEISLQAWAGPDDSRRLRLPHFETICT
jgi:hypothetical protein